MDSHNDTWAGNLLVWNVDIEGDVRRVRTPSGYLLERTSRLSFPGIDRIGNTTRGAERERHETGKNHS
jgi:hypothetical protein